MLDHLAVGLSGLCLLHCLLLPVALAALPFIGQLTDEHLHAEVLIVVVPLSVIALGLGYRHHRVMNVLAWGALGLSILIVGGTFVHSAYGLMTDRTLTVTGSIILAITHYRNFRLSRE